MEFFVKRYLSFFIQAKEKKKNVKNEDIAGKNDSSASVVSSCEHVHPFSQEIVLLQNMSRIILNKRIILTITFIVFLLSLLISFFQANYKNALSSYFLRFFAFIFSPFDKYDLESFTYVRPSELLPSYDFIIVGGGTAGTVLAGRLSELNNITILLIEAGSIPENTKWSNLNIPVAALLNSRNKNYDWLIETKPQTHSCRMLNNRHSFWPRGRILGGTSFLNYLLYVRGNRKDFDSWRHLGASGWTYSEMLKYMKKMERICDSNIAFREEYRGTEGPIPVTSKIPPLNIIEKFVQAAMELGFKYNEDYNGEDQIGASFFQYNKLHGRRVTPFHAYLLTGKKNLRHKLHILTDAHVTRILFDSNQTVTGVEFVDIKNKNFVYSSNDMQHTTLQRQTINASKEVILSAGTVHSPQILMLSGVGPLSELSWHNITPVAVIDAVGKSLQDHIFVPILLYTKPEANLVNEQSVYTLKSFFDFFIFGRGAMTTTGCDAQLVIDRLKDTVDIKAEDDSDRTEKEEDDGFISSFKKFSLPDLQIHFSAGVPTMNEMSRIFNLPSNFSELVENGEQYGAPQNHRMAIALPTLLHPLSRGDITLKSSNPFDKPNVDPRYLTHQRDVDILIEGIDIVKKLIKTKSLSSMIEKYIELKTDKDEEYRNCLEKAEVEYKRNKQNKDEAEKGGGVGGGVDGGLGGGVGGVAEEKVAEEKDKDRSKVEYKEKLKRCERMMNESLVRSYTFTLYHPVGTCRIGKFVDNDVSNLQTSDGGNIPSLKGNASNSSLSAEGVSKTSGVKYNNYNKFAVVDENLKVCGGLCVKNLRIVDASVMPHLPSGNTHVPVIAIAEKAAELIKNEFSLKSDFE